MYDLKIENANLVDGNGGAARAATIAIRDGKIVAIEESIAETAERTIDAKGNLVTPGFIDVHTCLLYTSPSPRDRTRSRMPSSA